MANLLRHMSKHAISVLSRPSTPSAMTLSRPSTPSAMTAMSQRLPMIQSLLTTTSPIRSFATPAAKLKMDCIKKRPTVNCACARHPWPEENKECEVVEEKPKDCDFNFRKLEVNPFDHPCDCQDPPPAAGCADVGRPKEICCRSIRQYGCHCEEEDSCEEDWEETHQKMVEVKTCDLDFKKLEVNPYDDPCECHDAPPAAGCADLPKKDLCCKTTKPFSCYCEAYDQPGLDCFKQKAPKAEKLTEAKKCNGKKEWNGKCL